MQHKIERRQQVPKKVYSVRLSAWQAAQFIKLGGGNFTSGVELAIERAAGRRRNGSK